MFYRSQRRPFGRNVSRPTVRLLLAAMYVLYAAGCLVRLPADDSQTGLAFDFAGMVMIVASVLILLWLGGSSLQRQLHEEDARLDERELFERNRATTRAFSVFACIVLIGLLYMLIANDLVAGGKLDLWLPTNGDHWNALLGGALILSFTLPAACLAWTPDIPETE